jgi:hypothetical protein
MGPDSTHSNRRQDRWAARLVRVQMAVSGLAPRVEPPATEDRWPERLMRAGAALIGVGGLLLASWVRRRL